MPILSLGATSSSIACMIEGTPAITITSPTRSQAPPTPFEDEIRALGNARHAQAGLVHLGSGRLHPFVQNGERARIGVTRHAECLRHAVGGDVTVGWSDPAGGKDIGAATPGVFKAQELLEFDPLGGRPFSPFNRPLGGGWLKKEGAIPWGAEAAHLCYN